MPKVKASSVAVSTPFEANRGGSGINADEVQSAIELVYALAKNASRGATLCGFDGNAGTGRWLEFFANNPSNNNPFIIAEPAELVALSLSAASSATGTVTVFKNGSPITTISLAASQTARVKSLALGLTDLDGISVQVTSGNISRPTLAIFIRTLP